MNAKLISGYTAMTFTIGMKIPQIYKTLKTKKAKDISIYFLLFNLLGHISWVCYGIFDNINIPLIATDSVCLFLTFIIIGSKFYYDKKNSNIEPT